MSAALGALVATRPFHLDVLEMPRLGSGCHGFITRLQAHGIAFRKFIVPGTPPGQLFAYGPGGVQIEPTFDSRREDGPLPGCAYMAGESFVVSR